MQHYQFKYTVIDNQFHYFFSIKNGLEYIIKFKPSFWLSNENAYEISIENDLMLQSSDGFDSVINVQGSFNNSKIEHQYHTGILFSIYKSDIADLKETFQLLNEELNK